MKKTLREIPFEELAIGDRVVSATGKDGEISGFNEGDDHTIYFKWDDGTH